jgi:predicted DNA-binding ribbon-helix-helix protein
MSMLSVRLPQTLHNHLRQAAEAEGVSINQLVAIAIAEKVATLQTLDYLEQRAQRGSRAKLLAILAKAPDVEPEEPQDRL